MSAPASENDRESGIAEQTASQVGEYLDRHLQARQTGNDPPILPIPISGELRPLLSLVDQLHCLSDSLSTSGGDKREAMLSPTGDYEETSKSICVGKYAVARALGHGGQATALLAFDPDLRRHVVIKLYREARTPAEQEIVLKEGQALARVRSPYVAQCYHVDRHEGVPYLVVEYIPGKNLAEWPPPVSATWAVEVIRQGAEGLSAVHACGLLHRDLKPANIILADDGRPRLVDFGLASALDREDLRRISGTLAFMAPEQARGQTERIDPRTDLFGLGSVLYYLVTGRPPHQAGSTEALWQAAKDGYVTPAIEHNSKLPRGINDLCMRCLAKDPTQRFASTGEFIQAIRRWQHRWKKRPLFVAGALLAAALLAFGLTTLFRRSAPEDIEHNIALVLIDRHPDGRPLRRDFGIHAEIAGGMQDPAGMVTLTEGDLVRIHLTVDRQAYVGIWDVEEHGPITQLFPNSKESEYRMPAHRPRTIPGDPGWTFRAKPSRGSEYILLFAATKEWAPTPAMRGAGPEQMYPVYVTPPEQEQFHSLLRSLELVPTKPESVDNAVAEMIVPLKVVRKK